MLFRLIKRLNKVFPILTLGICLSIIGTVSSIFSPIVIKNTVDEVLTPLSKGLQLNVDALNRNLILYIMLMFIGLLVGYMANIIMMYCANKTAEDLRNECFDKMQSLPISYFDDKPAGKVATRIVYNTETLRRRFYGTILSQIFTNILNISIIYVMLFYLDYRIGFLLLIILPMFAIWQKIYSKKIEKPLKSYYDAQSEVNSKVNEAVNGRTIIQLFGRENDEIEAFGKSSQIMFDSNKDVLFVNSTISWNLVSFLNRIFQLLVLSIIGYTFLGGTLGVTVGLIFTTMEYSTRLFESLGMLVRLFPDVGRTFETGKRVYEILDQQSEVDPKEKLAVKNGDVEFKNITFSYKEGVPVLKNISFFAKKGETIALVGHTGSGKSSIMNLLFRFYDADSGEILIDGQNIVNYNRESVRKDMGIVLQDPYLFTGTISSNIKMGNEDITDETVFDSLKKVGADYMLQKLENGINEKVTEKGSTFSSGERQLISFARTLASNPKILILDEATSHIDTETEEIIQNAMEVVKEGRTTFIIAHRLSTIQNADKILVLENGEIVESGKHDELISLGGIYANMYKLQQKV